MSRIPATIAATATAPGRGGVGMIVFPAKPAAFEQTLSGGKTPKPRTAFTPTFSAATGSR